MFGKNNCKKCWKSISSKYDFCPYCGNFLKENIKEDFGLLGKNDILGENDLFSNPFFGGGIFDKVLGNALKVLEKELQKEMKQDKFVSPKSNFQLFINGKKIPLGNSNNFQNKTSVQKKNKKFSSIHFSEKNSKLFSKLKKVEPVTNIKRISNKVFYELSLPGVKSLDDISIIKLEGSIELRAISKDQAYFKVIPISLEISDLNFTKNKLILELVSNS